MKKIRILFESESYDAMAERGRFLMAMKEMGFEKITYHTYQIPGGATITGKLRSNTGRFKIWINNPRYIFLGDDKYSVDTIIEKVKVLIQESFDPDINKSKR